ncbi:3-hydroxyacyl-ACP dehydratase FabZ family protein [Lutibaculum baratangense]|uniref:(3R)-hydroxymyristoyl-[acyl carrier protein] dehydratase n=1 Tax=Lutibaculum baratangense AMV1 TaxID=631454 RepID=V4RLZ6_9HYPH|nr:3-hydroxyacyl-ACP dehydratase FabZ family protein [Lutibaculum baratangense]ESR24265.1 (3R)-hydroxymyristoyl-[acyl carrier protein] dehydratase [Lutibaculum baratangense AMV1]
MRPEYFQLISRIEAVDTAAGTARARAVVPEESTIFEGHFPGHPLMPGVLLIESMAQTSGFAILGMNGFEGMPFLAGVREAKLRRFVTPGNELDVEARVEHDGSGFAMTEASIRHEGSAVASAKLTFRVMPFPSPDFRTEMRSYAERLGFPLEVA